MIKMQQFKILKFSSKRLKKSKFNINTTYDQASLRGEVISLSQSELIRTLFRITNREFSQDKIDSLLLAQKKLKNKPDSKENQNKLLNINNQIEEQLFIKELVNIQFDHKNHYLEIMRLGGFTINGTKYVPFMASAGQVRRNTATFIDANIKKEIMEVLENGRDKSVPLVPAKWNSYFSLYSSSSYPVSFPRIVVVKDAEIVTTRKVDYITYQGEGIDDLVEEGKEFEIHANPFDGCGLVKPDFAAQWSRELELDYVGSTFCVRAPYLKGMLVTFDIDLFSKIVAGKKEIVDIYGKKVNVDDIDAVISESMLKLWSSYKSTEDYLENCKKNQLGFGISKVNPKEEKSHCRSSYQFLQVLDLNDDQVKDLCQPTIDWFKDLSGLDAQKMILYSLGESSLDDDWFERLDPVVKALILDNRLAKDPYVRKYFTDTLDKRKRDSLKGSILLNGHYDAMVAEPYSQCCHVFELPIKSLLNDGEHYNKYWLDKGVKTVAAVRSPIVHNSELNVLHLQNKPELHFWYKHIQSGTIFPPYGIGLDDAIMGGADHDFDICCTINNQTMIDGRIPSLPIFYESKKAKKIIINDTSENILVDAQIKGYNSKVGFCTNVSSSYFCLQEEFPKDSRERKVISNRLKILRAIQGEIIDGVKGLEVPPFRSHWTKPKKYTLDMTQEKIREIKFNNSVCITQRPFYFRWLYNDYMKRYRDEIECDYDIRSIADFGLRFYDLLSKENKTEEELELVAEYKRRSYFIDNDSVVNRISRYLEKSIQDLKENNKKESYDYTILMDESIQIDDNKLNKMIALFDKYKSFKKKNFNKYSDEENRFENLEQLITVLKKDSYKTISSNKRELANLAVYLVYHIYKTASKDFVWDLFWDGIVENLKKKSSEYVRIPFWDDDGTFGYLWKRYSLKKYSLSELEDNAQ
jgi:hypothetical protein